MFEGRTFKNKDEVRNHLFEFHSQDVTLRGGETLEDLMDIGGWEIKEIFETFHSFKTPEIFEQFLRCKNWKDYELDYITVDDVVYTMHEYDSDGKYLDWGNKKHDKLIRVETSNRYDKNIGFTDAKVFVFDNWGLWRNDINFVE